MFLFVFDPENVRKSKFSYLISNIRRFVFCIGVGKQEHCINAKTKGQKGDNLGCACVEGQTKKCAKAEASGDRDGDEENSGKAESGLGSDDVAPTEQSKSGVH